MKYNTQIPCDLNYNFVAVISYDNFPSKDNGTSEERSFEYLFIFI